MRGYGFLGRYLLLEYYVRPGSPFWSETRVEKFLRIGRKVVFREGKRREAGDSSPFDFDVRKLGNEEKQEKRENKG